MKTFISFWKQCHMVTWLYGVWDEILCFPLWFRNTFHILEWYWNLIYVVNTFQGINWIFHKAEVKLEWLQLCHACQGQCAQDVLRPREPCTSWTKMEMLMHVWKGQGGLLGQAWDTDITNEHIYIFPNLFLKYLFKVHFGWEGKNREVTPINKERLGIEQRREL